jgi:SAM-dependent methyltransferase
MRAMATTDRFDQVRASLLEGRRWDGSFDDLLPLPVRVKASRYWSPLSVACRAASRFADFGARQILDVGAGPGKFCIAAALARPELQLCGVEQREPLVDIARDLALRLELPNLEFRIGNALSIPWAEFDGFYFFNPFSENIFSSENIFDDAVELSEARLASELLCVIELLSSLRTGTVVVTYCGLGGAIPSSFDLMREEPVGSGALRTWIKRRSYEDVWCHLDLHDDVSRMRRRGLQEHLEHFSSAAAGPSE